MSVSFAQKFFLCISITGFGGLLVFLGIALHLAYAKMDVMLDHLKTARLLWSGLLSRTAELGEGY
ncbi:hypothetical protein D3C76_1029150 [compost metagenome]|uniref:Uncharacterized protein n=1 Tax=Pseudomonas fluorescens TaxID=294 RepID=A0A5E6PPI6_PSEFL|nr:hypothetical protein [Pseudomonas fluorescens]VVM45333.1 hypothetical protein PS659_00502 [Pseudomonas fluorescens]